MPCACSQKSPTSEVTRKAKRTGGSELLSGGIPRLSMNWVVKSKRRVIWTPARILYLKAANQGMALAMNNLGAIAQKAGDEAAARDWYRKAAERGLPLGMQNFACLIWNEGKADDAKLWFARAADLGDVPSMTHLGWILGQEGRLSEARDLLLRAARLGEVDAMFKLGVLSEEANDIDAAWQWYKAAGDAGHQQALVASYRLALIVAAGNDSSNRY